MLIQENGVLTFVPCRARGLFSVDTNLVEMFRFQDVVMSVLAFRSVLTR
jgi:hypothetical protein